MAVLTERIEKLTKEKDRLEAELEKAKEALELEKGLPLNKQLANFLHEKTCSGNHTDQCGWYYGPNDWNDYSHKKYLKLADEVLEIVRNG